MTWAIMPRIGERSHQWCALPGTGIETDEGPVTHWRARCGLIAWTDAWHRPMSEDNVQRCVRCLREPPC